MMKVALYLRVLANAAAANGVMAPRCDHRFDESEQQESASSGDRMAVQADRASRDRCCLVAHWRTPAAPVLAEDFAAR